MAFGIPTSDQISTIITNAISQAKAAGIVLEDHEAAVLHDTIHNALVEATADLAPVLQAVAEVNLSLQGILKAIQPISDLSKRLDGASVTLTLGKS